MTWDPSLYLTFGDLRTRPAADLLGRVPHPAPVTVVDLGCGPGNSTRLLADRWPDADVLGIDASETMLERARADHPDIRFDLGDITKWAPAQPVDVVFANASLHWLPDHTTRLRPLLDHVAPGGSLAMQIPNNSDEPSHAEARRIVRERFADLDGILSDRPVFTLEEHYDALAGPGIVVDVWESTYLQPLAGPERIVEWTSSTFLRPLLAALADEPERRAAFLDAYGESMAASYPTGADGMVLLPFPRLFAVATRR